MVVPVETNADLDNEVLKLASNLHVDTDEEEDGDGFLDTSFLTESKPSNSKSSNSKDVLMDEDVINLPIEYLKPAD